ncbi:hypothetical protein ACIP6P_04340 [Streptomyces sp. NPDC088729]|uniref:hypothetical protein n=1 Tax=Streptomyces sp. NPDC088729 TaxID=3365876 RepID=UPI003819235D
MRLSTFLATVALASTGVFATSMPAVADGGGINGDNNTTATAIVKGGGSATATANGGGGQTDQGGGGGSTPPVGTPETGTLQLTGTAIAAQVNLTYSCPAGAPSDTIVTAVVSQASTGAAGQTAVSAICDGTTKSVALAVIAQPGQSFAHGPALAFGTMFSNTNPSFNHTTPTVTLTL